MQAAPPAGTWMRQQPGFSTAFLTGGVWERREECGALEEMEEETVPSKRPFGVVGCHSFSKSIQNNPMQLGRSGQRYHQNG